MSTDTHSRRIEEVSAASADADQLVTVAVAPGDSVGAMHERIEEADARAEYLDGEQVPEPRREALQRARRVLGQYDRTPENGLVVYTGVVDGELVDYVFDDLPAPVPETTLEHGNAFDTDPLDAATTSAETYGLLVVQRGGAALGTYTGDAIDLRETLESDVPGKTRAGGQSAARFKRRREKRKEAFFEEVAAAAKREFLADASIPDAVGSDRSTETAGDSGETIDGLLLGGTEVTIEAFRDGDYLDYRLEDLLVDTFHVEYASEQGLRQLAKKAEPELETDRAAREALDAFFDRLKAEDGAVVYGREETEQALTYDAVETLLVSEARPIETRQSLRTEAENEGGELVTIPTELEGGEQFADAFGGVAALLRFPID